MMCYADQADRSAIVDYLSQTFSALGLPVSEKHVEPLRALRFAVGPIQGVVLHITGNPSQKHMTQGESVPILYLSL
jgi:hypothetical protein